jgi:hypothetical protein
MGVNLRNVCVIKKEDIPRNDDVVPVKMYRTHLAGWELNEAMRSLPFEEFSGVLYHSIYPRGDEDADDDDGEGFRGDLWYNKFQAISINDFVTTLTNYLASFGESLDDPESAAQALKQMVTELYLLATDHVVVIFWG